MNGREIRIFASETIFNYGKSLNIVDGNRSLILIINGNYIIKAVYLWVDLAWRSKRFLSSKRAWLQLTIYLMQHFIAN